MAHLLAIAALDTVVTVAIVAVVAVVVTRAAVPFEERLLPESLSYSVDGLELVLVQLVGVDVGDAVLVVLLGDDGDRLVVLLVDILQLGGEVDGLVQCGLAGLHELGPHWLSSAGEEQLMLEEHLHVGDAFCLGGLHVIGRDGGRVGRGDLDGGHGGWLAFAQPLVDPEQAEVELVGIFTWPLSEFH